MAFKVRDNDRTTIPTTGYTASTLQECAVGGREFIFLSIIEESTDTVTMTGESITSGGADFYLASPEYGPMDSDDPAILSAQRVICIVFEPTSTGTKTGEYRVTVGGTPYIIGLSGVCGTAAVAIEIEDGLTPSYTREAPCNIAARFDPTATRLAAPFRDCYFKWVITPPGAQTLLVDDPRPYGLGTTRDVFQHYQGNAIDIPVLEGQHGDWKFDLTVYMPDPDPEVMTPVTITATQVTVTVNALGTAKSTVNVNTDGSGGRTAYATIKAAPANDTHYILHDDGAGAGAYTAAGAFNLASVENVSIVGAPGNSVPIIFMNSSGSASVLRMESTKGLFLQNLKIDPFSDDTHDAIELRNSTNTGFYNVTFGGGGVIANVHQGNSFQNLFACGVDSNYDTPMTQWPRGTGLYFCTGTETYDYSISGMAVSWVELGCHFSGSTSETVLRSLFTPALPLGTWLAPFGDMGFWFYNAVLTEHETTNITTPKPCWRFMGSRYIHLNQCYSHGTSTLGQGETGSLQDVGICVDIAYIHSCFDFNPTDLNLLGMNAGLISAGIVGCYSRKLNSAQGQLINLRQMAEVINTTLHHNSSHPASLINCNDGGGVSGWTGVDTEESVGTARLSGGFHSCITIASSNTNNNWFRDMTGTAHPMRDTNCITNSVFPSTHANSYDVDGNVYTSPTTLNASVYASGNIEVDVTLDANGRPDQDTSVDIGRDNRYYFDYVLKELTDENWAGPIQSATVPESVTDRYLLEDGSGVYLMEDGVDAYLLEQDGPSGAPAPPAGAFPTIVCGPQIGPKLG